MGRGRRRSLQLESHLVDVAPVPVLARFVGPDDGVSHGPEVPGGVTPRGLVAAPHVAALLADAQVHPVTLAGRETVLTAGRRRGHVNDLVEKFEPYVYRQPNTVFRNQGDGTFTLTDSGMSLTKARIAAVGLRTLPKVFEKS